MGVGLRLKEISKQKGITIKYISEKTGIPVNTLYSIIKRDSARVSTETIQAIAEVLQVHPARLISYSVHDPEKYSREELNELDTTAWLFYQDAEIEELAQPLLTAFYMLNSSGMQKAIERVQELTEIPKYQAKKQQ